ncbi:MAG: ATP-binding protein [Fusobacteriaceae bacterium]|nr:ATP-binding protein [Fusobacteriaceae bacterium]MBN2838913.1 ATP-binding protein [Fusobacteriaceae bacterium]
MRANTIVGQVARGDKFFKRDIEIEKILRQIEGGRNILISAPRRVGKTSLMSYIKENPPKDYRIIYLNTESVNSGNEFFKKLLNTIIREFESLKKYTVSIKKFLSKIDGIGKDGVTLSDKELNYFFELIDFFEKLNLENEKLVIMIDEYAQTVQNILKNEGKERAVNFLQMNRELRQKDFTKSIQYVYAGSIGLENVVSKIERTNDINDLVSLKVNPLDNEETKGLINQITKDSGLVFNDDVINYIITKMEWLIPYYIQILVDEIDQMKSKRDVAVVIEKEEIEMAFEKMLEHRTYYSYWHERLRSLNKDEYNFAKEILNFVSENDKISSSEIFNVSQKYSMDNVDYKEVLNELKHDGYLNNEENIKEYKFNSPILKVWWYRNVAN